jgi:hypothetical protein
MNDTEILNLSDVINKKKDAKNAIKRGDYVEGVEILRSVIAWLEKTLQSRKTVGGRAEIAKQLAESHGICGGAYRRWALREEGKDERQEFLLCSIMEYDKGYDYEAVHDYGIVDSYNLLNRLVSRILNDPASLTNGAETPNCQKIKPLRVRGELEEVVETVTTQLQEGRRDAVWANADLGLANLLLGRSDGVRSFADFMHGPPAPAPDYAYESLLSTLCPLAHANLPMAAKIWEAVAELKCNLNRILKDVSAA